MEAFEMDPRGGADRIDAGADLQKMLSGQVTHVAGRDTEDLLRGTIYSASGGAYDGRPPHDGHRTRVDDNGHDGWGTLPPDNADFGSDGGHNTGGAWDGDGLFGDGGGSVDDPLAIGHGLPPDPSGIQPPEHGEFASGYGEHDQRHEDDPELLRNDVGGQGDGAAAFDHLQAQAGDGFGARHDGVSPVKEDAPLRRGRKFGLRTVLLGSAVVVVILVGGMVAAKRFFSPRIVYHPAYHLAVPVKTDGRAPVAPASALQAPRQIAPPKSEARAQGVNDSAVPSSAANGKARAMNSPTAEMPSGNTEGPAITALRAKYTDLKTQIGGLKKQMQEMKSDFATKLGGIHAQLAAMAAKRTSTTSSLGAEIAKVRAQVDRIVTARNKPVPDAVPVAMGGSGSDRVLSGFQLTGVSRTAAAINGPDGSVTVPLGDEIPGAGTAKSFKVWHGTYELVTSEGVIRPAVR